MRTLTRRIARERWSFSCDEFEINEKGVGHAIYTTCGPQNTYSLIAFAHDLPFEKRSDRVIADAWDITFTLFDGIPTKEDVNRLSNNIPLQEKGRATEKELSISRANRSVRLWEYVVDCLASQRQPLQEEVDKVGYLMRTTAVYGSGKFGASDREAISHRPEFQAPFQVEMLTVYLVRWFVLDLVQHMANERSKKNNRTAAKLSSKIARSLGIGNSTGLGMAPFLLNHPALFNNWITAREKAIQKVRSLKTASSSEIDLFLSLVERSKITIANWHSEHPIQIEKLTALRKDADQLTRYLKGDPPAGPHPWENLYSWAEKNLSIEGQEWIASLILEPYDSLIDPLTEEMSIDDSQAFHINGSMSTGRLCKIIEDIYAWAIEIDWQAPENNARAWYVSEEKLEPRLGERFEEPIEDYEQPLSPARDIVALYKKARHWPEDAPLAEFLLRHPQHRHALRRVQIVENAPYAEIRDNTISSQLLPIDMLRCKLSFFGATQFDPRSDRWVRVCMYGNAPLPEEINTDNADFWIYPDAQ